MTSADRLLDGMYKACAVEAAFEGCTPIGLLERLIAWLDADPQPPVAEARAEEDRETAKILRETAAAIADTRRGLSSSGLNDAESRLRSTLAVIPPMPYEAYYRPPPLDWFDRQAILERQKAADAREAAQAADPHGVYVHGQLESVWPTKAEAMQHAAYTGRNNGNWTVRRFDGPARDLATNETFESYEAYKRRRQREGTSAP